MECNCFVGHNIVLMQKIHHTIKKHKAIYISLGTWLQMKRSCCSPYGISVKMLRNVLTNRVLMIAILLFCPADRNTYSILPLHCVIYLFFRNEPKEFGKPQLCVYSLLFYSNTMRPNTKQFFSANQSLPL